MLSTVDNICILYAVDMKGIQSVTIKLRQHYSTPAQQITATEKIVEFTDAGIEPTTFCLLGRHPNH